MTGCSHNTERTFLYPVQSNVPRSETHGGTRITFLPGDNIRLVCPHGCADIHLRVNDDEAKQEEYNHGNKS